jgi:hypothetical protein
MPHPTPVSTHDRIETLDVLRGFALLGILAMNIRGMAAPLSTYMYPYALFDYSGASRAAYLFTSVVFDLTSHRGCAPSPSSFRSHATLPIAAIARPTAVAVTST